MAYDPLSLDESLAHVVDGQREGVRGKVCPQYIEFLLIPYDRPVYRR